MLAISLREALEEWGIHLRAMRRSQQTVKSYTDGVRFFLDWCEEAGIEPDLVPAVVNRFMVALEERGNKGSTLVSRQLAIRRFSAWLAQEGIIEADRLAGMKRPGLEVPVMEPLTDEELRALVKACAGTTMRDRRDEAIVRLLAETGLRAGECIGLELPDVDLQRGTVVVRKGKGGKGRVVGIGPQTSQSIARYLRTRKGHRLEGHAALWLGERGRAFTYDAMHKALRDRATRAGIDRFHPHLLRNTFAHRWLSASGSQAGLMAAAGWSRPDMLVRYTAFHQQARAVDEARRLNLGDV